MFMSVMSVHVTVFPSAVTTTILGLVTTEFVFR